MWQIAGRPEVITENTGGYDGVWYRWPLIEGDRRTFTVIKVTDHARLRANERMSQRAVDAVKTCGRSEVSRTLAADFPPRVIEVGSQGEPIVVPR